VKLGYADTHDPARLAAVLRERGLPGRRSKTAITKLRRERARRNPPPPARPPSLAERARSRMVALYAAEITRRGGETSIAGRYETARLYPSGQDRRARLVLLHAEGYRDYGQREGCHWSRLSYLCGVDDSGRWAVRVPGTVTGTWAAVSWLTPAAVQRAVRLGRQVRRQGDIYAIEMRRQGDTASGWVGDDWRQDARTGRRVTSHYWNAETRYLTHHPEDGRKHRPVRISYPARFVQQRAYGMGRTSARGAGD